MPKAIFTTEAEQDLGRIVDYIAQDSVLAALSWLEEMRAVCDLIATQPGIGQPMQTNRFGDVRRHVTGNYLIYYQPHGSTVSIARVVHGAREQDRLI
ncbi:MAG TPA: type II toxin-antitoxin system RelE/ParE family toxin [Pirellulales bacterium]|jgi:plasmid stabilization system protein ParE|nr:type II toxin-antitoxin system RelE/ParE family toxin [Pirellulales bacterium]